jgi:hypothetical protein
MRLLDSSTEYQELVEGSFIVPTDKSSVLVGADGVPYELYGKSKVALSRKLGTLSDSFHIHSGSVNQ